MKEHILILMIRALVLLMVAGVSAQVVPVRVMPVGSVLVFPLNPTVAGISAVFADPLKISVGLPLVALPLPAASVSVPVAKPSAIASAQALLPRKSRAGSSPGRQAGVYDGMRHARGSFDAPSFSPGYLSETDGKNGAELVDALHAITGRNAAMSSYDAAKVAMFSRVDNVVRQGVRGVIAAYSSVFVPGTSGRGQEYKEPGDANGDGHRDSHGMNAEHLWPQSFFRGRSPMKSDLHHLLPTFVYPNSIRGRFPIGTVPDHDVEYRNQAGAKLGGGVFEPPDAVKGRVARGLLYFFVRYHTDPILPRGTMNRFWNSRIETYLRWNREFPPEDEERRRNDRVQAHQGNRNPFVDNPGLADRIGEEAFRMQMKNGTGFAVRKVRR